MKFNIVNRCTEDMGSMHGMLKSFLPFARKRMGFDKPPSIYFQSDEGNAQRLLGKTAHYDPTTMNVTVYVTGRHPKDVLRSLSHELVHHAQNCRGDFTNLPDTAPGYAQKDQHLRRMEEEAYSVGNMCFRDWEDGVKTGKLKISVKINESLLREEEETHTVVKGDTLSGIAKEKYGNARKWPIIYLNNRSQIQDPDLIFPGMKLIIPPESEFSDLSKSEIHSIYNLSAFYNPTGVTGGTSKEKSMKSIEIDESEILFPIRLEDRPRRISSGFGMRGPIKKLAHLGDRYGKRHMHKGIDIGVGIGKDVIAPANGVITFVRTGSESAGNYIHLLHNTGDGYRKYRFLHLDRILVAQGQNVEKGEVIGKSGDTGPAGMDPHLHFEILTDVNEDGTGGVAQDPMQFYRTKKITSLPEWRNLELNKLLLEKFNLGEKK